MRETAPNAAKKSRHLGAFAPGVEISYNTAGIVCLKGNQILYPDQPQQSQEKLSDITVRQFNTSLAIPIAAFVLSIISIALSIFAIGLIFGIAGFILAIVCIQSKKNLGRPLALWGLWLSLIGIILSLLCGYFFIVRPYLYARRALGQRGEKQFAKWINRPSPDFTIHTLDGNDISLSGLKGKRVVLDFWATWCPPCKREIPHFVKMRSETNSNELIIIGISSESAETLKEFVAANAINYPIASESDLPAPYDNIRSIPTTFFIDRNGVIQKVLQGYHDFNILRENALLPDYAEPDVLTAPVSVDINMAGELNSVP
jgi:peroxiredoxin